MGKDALLPEITMGGNEPAGVSTMPHRLVSLDAFRGATIAAMILVNNPGRWSRAYAWMRHAPWNGWTFADTIFPFFLFIIGVSGVLSLARRKVTSSPNHQTVLKILRRALILFGLGLLLNGFPYYDLSELRIPGVLQRIAVCYLTTALLVLHTRISSQFWVLVGLLASYWLMLEFAPVPGVGAGILEPGKDFPSYVDGLLLQGHLWYNIRPFDPEGLLSTIPAIGTTLFGVLTGHWLRSGRSMAEKAIGMMACGLLLLLAGWAVSAWMPINKNIWTPSYVLFMAGLALVCLTSFYWLIDIKGRKEVATPLVIFGLNAITAYVLADLLSKIMKEVMVRLPDGTRTRLRSYLFDSFFASWTSAKLASLLFGACFVGLIFAAMWGMWKRRCFLKV